LPYGGGEKKRTVLFHGSLERRQNNEAIDFIIDELLPEIEKKVEFRPCIFGSGTPPEKLSKNINRITFLGPVDGRGRMIRGADITIVPLRNSGGINIRILDSLACQVPTVVSPDAAKGLPDGLLDFVSVASSAKEIVEKIESAFESEASLLSGDRFREIMGVQSASNIVRDCELRGAAGLMPLT